ncbi:hypothetical protein JRO89_XSUnG0155900 [Xanthoceras sorbifolium]|uniref:Uncharacterized protein n=1 Tax=Xanthoceras sorbifolium TaxID=99658 RepID=A0ABQ8GZA7_9ROSI|nr:hypothetical protein JRO89_XSUnG0155900 [Xanthoceras sorbifolium]
MDHESRLRRLVETDWYSPRRLLSSPTQYDFPGDRFIPNRSLMNLDQAHCLLTTKLKEYKNPKFNDAYRKKIADNLTLDSEGRPFRMLVFRGSPKSSRKSCRLIDEIRREDAEALKNSTRQSRHRKLPKQEARILDAPNLMDDYYQNIMDWGKNNILAVALGSALYLWNSTNGNVKKLLQVPEEDDYPTSVAWSGSATNLAVGYMSSKLQLWDTETSKLVNLSFSSLSPSNCLPVSFNCSNFDMQVRSLEGHKRRVATVSWNHWNSHVLTSGSLDKSIINHDVRVSNNVTSRIRAHTENSMIILLLSRLLHGALISLMYLPLVEAQKMGVLRYGMYKRENVCGLEWNRHHKEILSGHGYSESGNHNKLCLWEYPSMTKVGELKSHRSRVIELSQSPDGLTAVSAGADQTLCFWEVFGPPINEDSNVSYLDGLLSLKLSPIR